MARITVISESAQDNALSVVLNILKAAGHSSTLIGDVPLGESWTEHLSKSLSESDAAIAIVSRGSPSIYYEIGLAAGLQRSPLVLSLKTVDLPVDLLGQFQITYDAATIRSETFAYRLAKSIDVLLRSKQGQSQSHWRRIETADHRVTAIEQIATPTLATLDISSIEAIADSRERGSLFEKWLVSRASAISEWDIIEKPQGRPQAYDFTVWNHIDDPSLKALGNPIVFEVKAPRNPHANDVSKFIHAASRAGIASFVLAILGELPTSVWREARQIHRNSGIYPIVLDIKDLRAIRQPIDLALRIRDRMRELVGGGGPRV